MKTTAIFGIIFQYSPWLLFWTVKVVIFRRFLLLFHFDHSEKFQRVGVGMDDLVLETHHETPYIFKSIFISPCPAFSTDRRVEWLRYSYMIFHFIGSPQMYFIVQAYSNGIEKSRSHSNFNFCDFFAKIHLKFSMKNSKKFPSPKISFCHKVLEELFFFAPWAKWLDPMIFSTVLKITSWQHCFSNPHPFFPQSEASRGNVASMLRIRYF